MQIARYVASCYPSRMDSKETRRANLKRLIRDRAGDNQREFAEMCGLNVSHLSQMVNKHRDVGDKIARQIETALRLGYGELDHVESPTLTSAAQEVGRDWMLLAEPLRSQWRDAIHAAAEVARSMPPPATDKRVSETISAPLNAVPAGIKKKRF